MVTAELPLRLRLAPGLSLVERDDGGVSVTSALGTVTLARPGAGGLAALRRLAGSGGTLDELADLVLLEDPDAPLYRLYLRIEELGSRGLLQHSVLDEERAVATITGVGRQYRFDTTPLERDRAFVLSRFAWCRRDGAQMALECSLGHARIALEAPIAAAVVALLAEPRSVNDAVDLLPDAGAGVVAGCFQLLASAGALSPVGADGTPSEDADPTRAQWSFHDLLFHSRSRFGRHSEPYGATFRHAGRIAPLPAVKPPPEGNVVELPVANLTRATELDPPFTQVLEQRRSAAVHGDDPMTLGQLGEFLYRVARVRATGSLEVPGRTASMETTSRPYPAGGSCYELEVYPMVDRCHSLARGVYHYDPAGHRLTSLRAADERVEALLRYAGIASPGARPQVLLVMAARYARVGWKYDSIAYATTLKNLGVLLQTMYLVATAMGLAGCALGSGDADLFCDATGTDYLAESSVGEFMLGTMPAATVEP